MDIEIYHCKSYNLSVFQQFHTGFRMNPDFFRYFLLLMILTATAGYVIYLHFRMGFLSKKYDEVLHKNTEIGNFLKIFSKNLKTVEEIEDSMNLTARYVSDLVGASSLCIFIEENGFLKACGISGAFPPMHKSPEFVLTKPRYILESLRREKIKIGDGIIGETALKREPILLENASEDPRIIAVDSVVAIDTFMSAPLVTEGKLIGVICAVNNRKDGEPFSLEQFNTFKFIADQVVLGYNIVNVYSNLSKQQRISQELEFAKQLQASLLPAKFPEDENYIIHAFNRSAKEVGGDFYDFVEIDKNRLLVVVADACGKGIPACMLMAMTRSFIRANVEKFGTLRFLMQDLNNALFRDTGDERFVTVACCLIDRRNDTVEYVRAGHTELLVHVPDHSVRRIYPNGVASGLMPSEIAGEYDSISFTFVPGMYLLFFTDGITEAINEKEQEFGIDKLCEAFGESCDGNLMPHEIIDKILSKVDEFAPDEQQFDDQTLVVIKRNL